MSARPPAPDRIGGVCAGAIALYRTSFTRCLPLALIGALLSAAAGWYPMLRTNPIGNVGASLAAAVAATAQLQAMWRSPGLWVSYGATALVWLTVRAALIARQNAIALQRAGSLVDALTFALRRLPSMLLAAFIWIVALVGGTLLLVVPGIWLGGQLQLWLVVMFAEDLGALQSLSKSWRLIEGNWWRTSTLVTVAAVISLIPSLFDGVGGTLASAVFKADTATAVMMGQLMSSLVSVVTMPMASAVMLAIYRELKRRRDNLGSAGKSLQTVSRPSV